MIVDILVGLALLVIGTFVFVLTPLTVGKAADDNASVPVLLAIHFVGTGFYAATVYAFLQLAGQP